MVKGRVVETMVQIASSAQLKFAYIDASPSFIVSIFHVALQIGGQE